ncbi:MAG: YhdP family protein [Hydrogenophaga sp.]|nr:YhdP family protein [Hydrogenophaga sp.]
MIQSPAPVAPATRTLKTLSVLTRALLWLVLAAWGLFALTWGVLHAFIVPRIGDWRPELERWASASVGVPVTVGAVSAESTGARAWLPALVPSVELRDVRLLDPQGREALHLPRVRAALSVASLWRRGFEQIVIDGPVLDVRRTAAGRIEVAGLDVSGNAAGDESAVDWFLDQREFVLRGGTLRWTDEQRAQPPLALDGVDLLVRNTARTHQLRLDATPPAEWGERFSLRARVREPLLSLPRRAASKRWERWDGELFADFQQVDLQHLRAYVDLSDWGVSVQAGQGALRSWADVTRGQVSGVTADLALQAVDAQLGTGLPPLLLDDLNGRLSARWNDEGFSLASDGLRFRTREGQEWPAAHLRLDHTTARAGRGASATLTADQLDLAALSALATRLPLSEASHRLLATLQPAGEVSDLSASWQAAAPLPGATTAVEPAPWRWPEWAGGTYKAKGRVTGLALAAQASGQRAPAGTHPLPGRPGFSGATVDFDLSQAGGRARLAVAGGALVMPGVFEEDALPLDRFEADASWRVQGERIEAQLDNVRLANADAEGTAQLRWHTGENQARFPGVLDLRATLTRADATRVHRYLPLVVSTDARHYVREAVRGGRSSRVDFRVQGALDQMPLDAPGAKGEFRIAAQLQGVDVDYVPAYLQSAGAPAWPALRGVNGELLLDRASLRLSSLQAGLEGAPGVRLSQAEIRIDDLMHSPTLQVNARAQGPATEVLGFVRNGPLNDMTGQALAQARIGGPAQVQFALTLPLEQIDNTRVNGTVQLAGNDVQITPDSPLLGRASGTVQFSESGFSVSGAQARLYGGEVRFEGGMRPDPAGGAPRIQFRGQGTASAEGLRDAGLGFVSRLFQHASGSTGYTAQLGFRGGVPELLVTSQLQGMAIQLPAPLGKSADAALPLRYDNAVLTMASEQARTDRLLVQLGSPLAPLALLHYERELGAADSRVLRGSVAVGLSPGEVAPLPAEGVVGNLRFGDIDADAWERAFATAAGTATRPAEPAGAGAPRAGPAPPDASRGYLPSSLALRASRLVVGGRPFHDLVVGASREGGQWRANVDADQLNGYVAYRQPGPGNAGSVYARLARLKLEPSVAGEVEQLLQQPTSVPALDIAVDELTVAQRRLGRVEIEAVNRSGPGRASEWRLNRLRLGVPEARLTASGNWAATGTGGPRRTALSFQLDIDDSGQLLNRFGRQGLVRGGKGRIEGQVGWLGSPFTVDYGSLSGQLQADVERGQFLKVEPGAAKLLGVLSLQALPRRLALDFRDVFSEGFSFDFVRGDARIEQGVLFTNNLQMKGINAAVLMEGTADLAREQQDLKVVVVPEINAGTAALIATAINPAVGLGSFLAQFLLRQPLQTAATQEFHITGGWDDPQIEKIDRRATTLEAARPNGSLP